MVGKPATWEVEVFFDGDCPLCRKEIAWVQGRDRSGKIRFTDIAAPSFTSGPYGMTHQEFMAEIQGRLPDGTWLTGVEVFRRMYAAIGFGWIVSATRWPIVSPVLDWGYKAFAKRRLALTGRCSLENAACRR